MTSMKAMNLADFKQTFDHWITDRTAQQGQRYDQIQAGHHADITERYNHARMILLSGGKRIRPFMTRCGYMLACDDQPQHDLTAILPVFASTELIHTMALMVDDIIDHGTLRHHTPTLHTHLHDQHQLDIHHSQSQTVLISDLFYNQAFKALLCPAVLDHPNRVAIINAFQTLIDEVIIGESLDTHMQQGNNADHTLIQHKDYLKTSSYTFIRPLMLGYELGTTDPRDTDTTHHTKKQEKDILMQITTAIGAGFQIMDDLLDITGGHRDKTPFSDFQEGQQNTCTLLLRQSTHPDLPAVQKLFGKKITDDEHTFISSVMAACNVITDTRDQALSHLKHARELMQTHGIESEGIHHVIDIIEHKVMNEPLG